jgi:VIT1/CCC1 family predicted Fe2+/Mn2+ transporter
LGLVVDDSSPFWGGVVTALSFAIFSLFPLLPYIIGAGIKKDNSTQYTLASLLIGGFELFSLGFAKAILIDSSGFQRLLSGV